MKVTAGKSRSKRSYVQGARAEAAEETGRRIVEAFLARVMEEWFDEITLDRVAADAGVTVQTVVRRFGGKEGLLEEAAKVLSEQINAQRATPSGDLGRLVANLIADYERTGDAIIRLLAIEPRHPAVSVCLNIGRRWHREWVERSLAGALEGLDAPRRLRAVDALVVATDVYTWKLLRRDMGRSVSAAGVVMAHLVRSTLGEFTNNHSSGDQL